MEPVVTIAANYTEYKSLYQIKGLVKKYGTPSQTVLDNIDLNIPEGGIFGLLGPNGAGKTTLLSIIVGLITKSSGEVLFRGRCLDNCLAEIRDSVALVPQDFAFYPMLSARENLNFFAGILNLDKSTLKSQIDFCIQTTGLEKHFDKKAQHYSGGLKRRLNLAIGLLNQPKLLCLDEPTVGIDPQSRNYILETITHLNRQGITIIYTSHYMEEVEKICDYVAIIDQGKILVVDEINELLKKHSEAELRIKFYSRLPQTLVCKIKKDYKVTQCDNRCITIKTRRPTRVIQELAPFLDNDNMVVERIHYGFKSLEELFLALTGKQLKDKLDD